MSETAELLEIIWVIVALFSFLGSIHFVADAVEIIQAVNRENRPPYVKLLAVQRLANELKRLLIGSIILFVGWVSTAYPPAQAFPWRTTVQFCWLTIALLNLINSLFSVWIARRVIELLDREER